MSAENAYLITQKAAGTASNPILVLAASSTFQPQIINNISGNPTAKTIATSIAAPSPLQKSNLIEADEEEVLNLFLQIEPEYKITNQILADL